MYANKGYANIIAPDKSYKKCSETNIMQCCQLNVYHKPIDDIFHTSTTTHCK